MKCPKCGGTGEMQICEMGFIGKDECDKCHGKGYLNNEEWLRSASANDMARCIATKLLELARNEYGIYDVVDYANVFEWLKQPHQKE